ncbi:MULTISPECIES: bifunctional 2-polyprenyl-6-hydroxyphenol methylase/3-demethylubiquinol 3-O-methyltransferase UbiG [unclassified Leptospira]|uniref:class I SAM-dependent methyltransferase n=1 Tax=unclassified Leptospira TaxID=2633828 RepID=UPI0002BF5A64|nr:MULTISPECIES: methyltransferase domain-containing protein [unclassified Leptospira]EMK02249.1 methyltransferase domain protein [Leptospira sp. B5-022]MCR1793621.1 SAM-dependent methyltransferase [Leptospira sp. id769339]
MQSPKSHYQNFLAEKYSWTLGDLSRKEKDQLEFFRSFEISPQRNGVAWDLGAGSGIQSIPLEKLGFQVTAIDFSQKLLSEIMIRKPDTKIRTKVADIRSEDLYQGVSPEILLCMGDTITHLESEKEWENTVSLWASFLSTGSKLILGYRDLSYGKPGDKNIFVVRSEESRIFTCQLQFTQGKVEVTDIFHEKSDKGWTVSASSYNKLILPIEEVIRTVSRKNFELKRRDEKNGMKFILFERL